MNEQKNSAVFLRPRFKLTIDESQQDLIAKFKNNLKDENYKYPSKIVDNHIIVDVPVREDQFWSPQLTIEIEKVTENKSVVKGLFGPKPTVWTLFMFFHFAVGISFIGFLIMGYVKWRLNDAYLFPLTMIIALPIVWILLYFLGRMGKKRGLKQMNNLYDIMHKTLKKGN